MRRRSSTANAVPSGGSTREVVNPIFAAAQRARAQLDVPALGSAAAAAAAAPGSDERPESARGPDSARARRGSGSGAALKNSKDSISMLSARASSATSIVITGTEDDEEKLSAVSSNSSSSVAMNDSGNVLCKTSVLISKNSGSRRKAWDDSSPSESPISHRRLVESPSPTSSSYAARDARSHKRASNFLPADLAVGSGNGSSIGRARSSSVSTIRADLHVDFADRRLMNLMRTNRFNQFRRVSSSPSLVSTLSVAKAVRSQHRRRRSSSLSALPSVHKASWLSSPEFANFRRRNERRREQLIDPIVYETVNGKKTIAAASASQLLDSFAGDGYDVIPDTDFICTFLVCHRYFIDSSELLDKLIDRYDNAGRGGRDKPTVEMVRMRTIKVIKRWIDTTLIGFRADHSLMDTIKTWVDQLCASENPTDKKWGSLLNASLTADESKTMAADLQKRIQELAPAPLLPVNLGQRKIHINDLDSLEVARQLTLIDHKMFKQLMASELYCGCWLKSKKDTTSPTVVAMAERFSKISYWMATAVVTASLEVEGRVEVLVKFISICEALMALNSFNSLMSLYCAFNMGPLQRLKTMWKKLPAKSLAVLKEVEALLDPKNNYKNYRSRLRVTSPPLVPFYAVILSDLTSFDEVPNKLANGHVNFEKMNMLGKVFKNIETWQQSNFMLHELSWIAEFLYTKNLEMKSEDDLYALSKLCSHYEEQIPEVKTKGRARSNSIASPFGKRNSAAGGGTQ